MIGLDCYSGCVVRICRIIPNIGIVMILACGCSSVSHQTAHPSEAQATVATSQAVVSPNINRPSSDGFPTFGKPGPNSIHVGIFGLSVKRPGYYYLERGATVHERLKQRRAYVLARIGGGPIRA
jgi:hypothetical protein